MQDKKSISLTIKPTNLCNFRCKHCFNGEHLYDKELLSIELACKTLELVAKKYNTIKVTFHGGEPTLVGKKYYEDLFAYEKELKKKYDVSFHHIFQTNGFLLDEKFIDMLISEKTLISISFDGLHNDILRSNTEEVYKVIELVQSKNGRLRVFCVETAKSILNLKETYEWFKSKNINYKILPIQPRGFAENQNELILNIDTYVNKLLKLYEYWIFDKESNIILYTFEEFIRLREDNSFKEIWFDRKLSLNADGKLYPFGRPHDINFCLGNPMLIEDIEDCFISDNYRELKNTLSEMIVKQCKNCKAYNVCGGNCLCSSFVYGNDQEMLDYACKLAEKTFLSVIEINKKVEQDIENGYLDKYSSKVIKYFYKEEIGSCACMNK